MRTYSGIRRALDIRGNWLLDAIERYCVAMSDNTRVVEWSCKVKADQFDGARFLHTALVPDYTWAAGAVNDLCHRLSLALGPQTSAALSMLLEWAAAHGTGVAVGYAERPSTQIKVYVTTRDIAAGASLLKTLLPGVPPPPRSTSKLMIATLVDAAGRSGSRAYYLWERESLTAPASTAWLARYCGECERNLIARSGGRTVSIAFKDGRDDMLYLSAPFCDPALLDVVAQRLAPHPMPRGELHELRWIGLARRGEGLHAAELNAYFNMVFD